MIPPRRQSFIHERLSQENGNPLWKERGLVWLRVTPRPGRLRFVGGVEEQHITHHISLRAGVAIRPGDRLRRKTRLLYVHAVTDPDGRDRWLECLCEEKTPDYADENIPAAMPENANVSSDMS